MNLQEKEIKRRTAIISHPDARGRTTLQTVALFGEKIRE